MSKQRDGKQDGGDQQESQDSDSQPHSYSFRGHESLGGFAQFRKSLRVIVRGVGACGFTAEQ